MRELGIFILTSLMTISFAVEASTCDSRDQLNRMRRQLGKKCSHEKDRFNCLDVIKVADGDTISVNIPGVHAYFGEDTFIRLYGLDTPESRPPSVKCLPTDVDDAQIDQDEYKKCLEAERLRACEIKASKEATQTLDQTVCSDSDRVDVKLNANASGKLFKEKYGRVLGNVYVTQYRGGQAKVINVKELLINESLAFEYDGGTKPTRDWCDKTIITDPKLQVKYVKDNFCSSRKCTEKTLQVRCFHRNGYPAQRDCYLNRIEKNINIWFRSCKGKQSLDAKNCYSKKANDYYGFCSQYSSNREIKDCRKDLKLPIEKYCDNLSGLAAQSCRSVL